MKNEETPHYFLKTPLTPLIKRGMKKTPRYCLAMPPLLSKGNVSLLTRRAGEVLRNLKHPIIAW